MRCLIDADVLIYEAAFGGEFKDEETGEKIIRPFEDVANLFDQKIREIHEACWATERAWLFLTGNEFLLRLENKERWWEDKPPLAFIPNFRFEVANTVAYKSTRSAKPYHYRNLLAYVHAQYRPRIAWGMEADDLICITQQRHLESNDTIICTRDKDLRACPGWHYGWECHNQEGFGPVEVDQLGEISLSANKKKVNGTGLKFFYSQMITGDKVDTIPGLPLGGPVMACKVLEDCTTEVDMYRAVKALYEAKGLSDDYFIDRDWE